MRIVIAEDEVLLRHGLQRLLEAEGFEVVDAVGDATSLLECVTSLRPDLVITDIRMPPGGTDDGLRAALDILGITPGTGVMVLSQHAQRSYARALLGAASGAVGYLLKQRVADVAQFTADLRRVAAGATVLDPEVVGPLPPEDDDAPGLRELTGRQRQVLSLVAQGRSNLAIAERLSITEKAVVRHISNIYDALAIPAHTEDHRRVLAVLRYLG